LETELRFSNRVHPPVCCIFRNSSGCKTVFFVEYVPVDGRIELALNEADRLTYKLILKLAINFGVTNII
jgi:hypothetical protein